MSKNNRKNKALHLKNKTVVNHVQADGCAGTDASVSEFEPGLTQPDSPEPDTPKAWIGVLNVDLYERLLKPAFVCFSQQHNDEPLRQLVESIVTAIALSEDQNAYRKINDISQRYLYYLERISDGTSSHWDYLETESLCEYWRSQVFMMLLRNSVDVFNLLLPVPQAVESPVCEMTESLFLKAMDCLSRSGLAYCCVKRSENKCFLLQDFSKGVSYPWLGYDTDRIFNLRDFSENTTGEVADAFALLENSVVSDLYNDLVKQIENILFIDLLYTQYKKIYEELSHAFDADESLPDDLLDMLRQRIRFDKNYQQAFDNILSGTPVCSKLHRASRIDLESLSGLGLFFSMFKYAFENHLGLYCFRC